MRALLELNGFDRVLERCLCARETPMEAGHAALPYSSTAIAGSAAGAAPIWGQVGPMPAVRSSARCWSWIFSPSIRSLFQQKARCPDAAFGIFGCHNRRRHRLLRSPMSLGRQRLTELVSVREMNIVGVVQRIVEGRCVAISNNLNLNSNFAAGWSSRGIFVDSNFKIQSQLKEIKLSASSVSANPVWRIQAALRETVYQTIKFDVNLL
jgi:hypothetical protein